jgi:hypothetical protein
MPADQTYDIQTTPQLLLILQVVFYSGAGLYNSEDNTADIIRSHQAVSGQQARRMVAAQAKSYTM